MSKSAIDILRAMRADGLTYAQLAKRTSLPEQQLIRWLTGKNRISQAYEIIIIKTLS